MSSHKDQGAHSSGGIGPRRASIEGSRSRGTVMRELRVVRAWCGEAIALRGKGYNVLAILGVLVLRGCRVQGA